ncbi:MAG: transposase [Chloroflexota bacterium]|nr:transposase [Chloroflexota bacterium]
MSLPAPLIPVLESFRSLFTSRTWPKALLLVQGTRLVRGRRTVAAALRVMGHAADPAFTCYHQVLNRAAGSPLAVSHVLLLRLVTTFLPRDAPIQIVCDEHLERRWGPRILKRGHYRDAVRSSKTRRVSSSGLCWLCCIVLVPLPWTASVWALPCLTILLTPPAVDRAAARRHKTLTRWTQQVVGRLRHWLPDRALVLLGAGHYSSLDLGNTCTAHRVQLVAPLRLAAALFAPAPPRSPGQRGAPRVKGAALPKLDTLLADPHTPWTRGVVPWDAPGEQERAWVSGQALW